MPPLLPFWPKTAEIRHFLVMKSGVSGSRLYLRGHPLRTPAHPSPIACVTIGYNLVDRYVTLGYTTGSYTKDIDMKPEEMKALRKGTGLSQEGLAKRLGVSRKFVNEMENGAPIDARTALAVQELARKIKLISDLFWIDESIRGTFIVIRRTDREHDRPNALYWGHSETMLYGEFVRRKDAERWTRALRHSENPRGTRKLMRAREAEVAEHEDQD